MWDIFPDQSSSQGNEENKRARNFPASLKRSAPPKEEAEEVESKHLKSGS